MNYRWISVAAVVLVLSAPLASRLGARGSVGDVEVGRAGVRALSASVLASGSLVYQDQANLSPEVIGRVTQVLVKEGEEVHAGQVMLRIDDQSYAAEVAQRRASVSLQRIDIAQQELAHANQERQFRRTNELGQRGLIARAQVDDARFSLDAAELRIRTSKESLQQAEAALRQSEEVLSKTTVTAPIAGTVIAVNIKVGETAVPSSIGIAGSSLMTIADTASIHAEVNIDEADIASVKDGQRVTLFSSTYPDKPIEGRIRSIPLAPRKNDASFGALQGGSGNARAYSVKVDITAAKDMVLRPGMNCRAEVYTAEGGQRLSLPIEAILHARQGTHSGVADHAAEVFYVYVYANGTASRRNVRVGLSDDRFQEIVGGLASSDRVVIGPYKILRQLADGDRVGLLKENAL